MSVAVHASAAWVLPRALVLAVFVSTHGGAEPARPHEYRAVEGCPAADEFWRRVAGSLERSGEDAGLSVSFSGDPRGIRGRLEVQRDDGRALERRVLAPTCAEAADALAIVIEQMSTTGFRELGVAAPEPPSQDVRATAVTAPPTRDAAPRPSAAGANAGAGVRVQLGGSARTTLPPGERWGGVGAFVLRSSQGPLHAELGVRARFHPSASLALPDGAVEFQWWAGELAPSLRLVTLTPSLELRGGAALTVGRLTSEGRGLSNARSASSPWVSLAPELTLAQDLGRWLLALSVASDFPVVGAEVSVGGHGVVFRSPTVGVASDLSLGVRF